jgi:hypothetical protein
MSFPVALLLALMPAESIVATAQRLGGIHRGGDKNA